MGKASSIDVTIAGTYVIVYDSAGCFKKDTVEVLSTLQPNLGEDVMICTNSFETLNANDQGVSHQYVWKKDGKIIDNETNLTLDVSVAATYSIELSASGCNSATDEIVVSSGLLDVNFETGIADEIITISVNGTSNYNWYATRIDERILETGNDFQFTMQRDTLFYVEDAEGYTGLVGKFRLYESDGRAWSDDRFERRMMFTVMKELSIDSITIYPATSLDATIRILASDESTVIFQQTYTGLNAGKNRLALNANLAIGDYYMDAVGTTGNLMHSNGADTNISFPYTIADIISVTGSNIPWINNTPYYLFFYNWRVSTGNTCSRTPVIATLETSNTVGLQESLTYGLSIYPNPTSSSITVTTNNVEICQLRITNIEGKEMLATKIKQQIKIDLSQFERGIYFLHSNNRIEKFIISR